MPPSPRPAGLFSSHLLAQLERLTFVSRRTWPGRVKGERKSPRKGVSVEFCDYRPYEIGDDLRYVDWNAFARLNRLYLKLFVDEEDLCIHLLLDASASMAFGEPSKFRYGQRLAAALAFIGLVNLERVGAGLFREQVAAGWSPSRGRNQFLPFVGSLLGVEPGGRTSFSGALRQYARKARDPGLAVVISDLLAPGGFEEGLRALMERGFDLHVVHLLSEEELDPPYAGDLELVDAETEESRDVTLDAEALAGYRRRLAAFLERVEGFCRTNELSYHRASTGVPLEDLLLRRLKGSLVQ